MNPHLKDIVTDPLGLAGYALFLVFGILTIVVKNRKKESKWIISAGFSLAFLCALGGLAIAWHRDSTKSENPAPPAPPSQAITIDKIDQKVDNGSATAGVQGPVTNNNAEPPKDAKPKH